MSEMILQQFDFYFRVKKVLFHTISAKKRT